MTVTKNREKSVAFCTWLTLVVFVCFLLLHSALAVAT